MLGLALFAIACAGTASSPTSTSATPDVETAIAPASLAELLTNADVAIEPDDLSSFVLRADGLTEVAESFRVWRDAPIDYEAHAETDPILLSESDGPGLALAGHIAHLVGRDGLTAVHAITAAELYDDAAAASRGFGARADAMEAGCFVLNLRESPLPDLGDEAVMVTATRTCSFGEPRRFGAVVSRHGPLVATTVIQRWDRASVNGAAIAVAEDQVAAIAAALGGAELAAGLETSTFGLCVPDPEAAAPDFLNETWRELNTDLIRTFTQPGSTANRDQEAIHRAVLDTLAQANAVLGTSYGGPIDVYFYESIEQLQQLAPAVSQDVLGFASGQEVHQLCGGTLDGTPWVNMAMSAHEYTHIITLNLWGRTSSTMLIEGLAHYVTVGERDSIVANFRIEPLRPLATIEDEDSLRGRAWGTLLASYLIEERGGIEGLQNLWFAARTATLGEAVEAIYSVTLEDLDAAVREEYDLAAAP